MDDIKKEYEIWYENNCALYEACGRRVRDLISNILNENKILYHSIDYRLKTKKSYVAKCLNEKYKNPTSEITDLCGLRIITYTNTAVQEICQVIKNEFNIDEKLS